jgi:hypothetical protein
MLTNYHSLKKANKEKGAVNGSETGIFTLLRQAIYGSLNENTDRVYIHDVSHLVEFKLQEKLGLTTIEDALKNKKLKILENKTVSGEILVHVFQIFPTLQKFEVWYRPQSKPRI